ncbi:MAG: V-type ATP synthase subunit I [Bacillota bacterium]|nr:V-type ATP synthase subunit I [Bacillota bacterium]
MAVLQIRKIVICALNQDRKAILRKLQSSGLMQLADVPEDDGFEVISAADEKSKSERETAACEQALAVLDQYAPEKKSMFASLEGKRKVSPAEWENAEKDRETVLNAASEITGLAKEIAAANAEAAKLRNQAETLKPWKNLGVPMNLSGTERTAYFAGTMPPGTDVGAIFRIISEKCDGLDAVDPSIITEDQDQTCVTIICMKSDAGRVEDALRSAGFSKFWQNTDETPAGKIEHLLKQAEDLDQKAKDLETKIAEKAQIRGNLEVVSDLGRVRAVNYDALGKIPRSKSAFVITGYAAEDNVPLLAMLVKPFDCSFEADEVPPDDENAPTILSNNAFSATTEGVVASYGLPSRKEMDPTTIMSFFYVFFFGMMLSDAAYGAIIAIACFFLIGKYKDMDSGMKKTMTMFGYCGISTLVWGVLFGGYFGDVVDVVARVFFGKTVSIPALWFVPLNDPMRLLLYSMLFGLIHLFVGLGIKGYNELKMGDTVGFFCDVVLWYIFLGGLILMLLPSSLFASIAGGQINLPAGLGAAAQPMAIIGLVGLILFSQRDQKNPVLRLLLGLYEVYGVTSWLSDVLSYSRLLALGLATGVIASVINQMGSMAGSGVVGAVIFAIVFVAGHLLNMAINILGAYVHTNRLQYVEFFGKFYDGSGKPFDPFHAETKYVTVPVDDTK